MALYATNRFPGDGTTTSYEFNFVGKYIARPHVKAYQEDNATKVRTYVPINDSNFLNDTTLRSLPVTPVGSTLVIYRETPKPPLVDFVNGSRLTEYNLDTATRQGAFIAAEVADASLGNVAESADRAEAAAQIAAGASAAAGTAKDRAVVAAAEATGAAQNNLKSFDSFADATTGAVLLQDGTAVEVAQDETRAGARTRYKVQAGALVFVVNLGQLRLDLADPVKGAAIVDYDGGTVQDVLDYAKPMQSYTALRAYTGRAAGARITSKGIAGFFQRDASDTTSVDNGGTIIVDASNRRWKRVFDGYFNVTWFGAVGNGVSGNAAANTAAINACIMAGQESGGTVYFPAGTYDVNPLTYDIQTLSQTGARVSILGDGPGLSVLRCGRMSLDDDILNVNAKHQTAINSIVSAGHISNIGFLSTNGYGGGLRLSNIAYFYVENVHASGCNTGLRISGSLSGTVINSKFSGNTFGVYASSGATGFSSPNAITFIQCVIGDNSDIGIYLSNPGGLRMFGGSVEGNGAGAANGYGILIDHTEAEGASVAADIQGVYFEFNKGVADIKLNHANPNENVTLNVRSCSFDCGGTNVVTDRIGVEHISAKAVILNVSECNFSELAGFSPSPAYKYIRVFGAGAGARHVVTFGNFYQSANSVPDFSKVKQLPVSSSARVEAFTGLTDTAGVATIPLSGFTATPRFNATVLDGSPAVAWSTSIVWATHEYVTVRVHRQPTAGGAWAAATGVAVCVLAVGN